MRVGITRFPGTNCDYDVWQMAEAREGSPRWLWHQDRFEPSSVDMIIVPGGFSFGDYLRCGALAAKSPVMDSVREFAARGGPVLGICNGFQILCESGLLPGVLVQNRDRKFIDEWADLVIAHPNAHFAKAFATGERLRLPIAHGEGRFMAPEDEMNRLRDGGQIWMTYDGCPNGSTDDIAGIFNKNGNVAALMPHPERALFDWMGGTDGWSFL